MANSTLHTGRLTADPELRAAGELEICDMRMAVQRRRGRNGEDRGAFFIPLVAFNGLAENCAKYLKKGSRILVVGQLDIQEWTGQDDVRRWTAKIIADQVEFLDQRKREDNRSDGEESSDPSSVASKPAKARQRSHA
jgi:single-strand DNA-binding protein